MKKILSLFAFVAIVISFAACGGKDGNVPEIKDFTFKVQALDEKARIFVTPANNQKEYYCWLVRKSDIEQYGSVRDYVEYELSDGSYSGLKHTGRIHTDMADFVTSDWGLHLYSYTYYVLYACYVENDGGDPKIVGDVEYVEFLTMPYVMLNGVFSVSDTKKVYFYRSNLMYPEYFYDEQWEYTGASSGSVYDLFPWSMTQYEDNINYMLSADEWWYLFRLRQNAANRFTFATILNIARGIILLPDVWEKPEDIPMMMPAEMEIRWDGPTKTYRHENISYDAFSNNKYTLKQWEYLELAGAVFLPACASNGKYGCYWSGTATNEEATEAGAIDFDGHALSMMHLKQDGYDVTSTSSIRMVTDIRWVNP